jgi:hypothetical protein
MADLQAASDSPQVSAARETLKNLVATRRSPKAAKTWATSTLHPLEERKFHCLQFTRADAKTA